MTVGRIPWSTIRKYGREEFGLDGVLLDGFWILMSTLDVGFGEWMSEEHERHRKQRDTASRAASSAKRSRSKGTYSRG